MWFFIAVIVSIVVLYFSKKRIQIILEKFKNIIKEWIPKSIKIQHIHEGNHNSTEVCKSQKESKLNLHTTYKKALELQRLKQYDKSLKTFNRALELSENNYIFQVKIYRAMAKSWGSKGDNSNAVDCYNRAMEISIKILGDKYPMARYEIACEELDRLKLNIT